MPWLLNRPLSHLERLSPDVDGALLVLRSTALEATEAMSDATRLRELSDDYEHYATLDPPEWAHEMQRAVIREIEDVVQRMRLRCTPKPELIEPRKRKRFGRKR